MTPCMRLYAFLGQTLAKKEVAPLYAEWVKTYADPGFEALAVRLEACSTSMRATARSVRANYRRAMELEYGFFDANALKRGELLHRAVERAVQIGGELARPSPRALPARRRPTAAGRA